MSGGEPQLPPGVRWLPFIACLILALIGKLTTWWGIAIVVVVAAVTFTGYLAVVNEDVLLTMAFFFTQPFIIGAMYAAYLLWEPWTVIPMGLAASAVTAAVFAVWSTRMTSSAERRAAAVDPEALGSPNGE